MIAVPPPQRGYRRRLVERQFDLIGESEGKRVAIASLIDHTDELLRSEIQRACQVILSSGIDWTDGPRVSHTVFEAVKKIRESLTITEYEYRAFQDNKQKYSHPVTRKQVDP
jgi:hypothetical protein